MAISGHKTESIYRRYDTVANRDLSDAAFKMEQYFSAMEKSLDTLRGTPEKNPQAENTANTQILPRKSLN
jgi:hypothetical protein